MAFADEFRAFAKEMLGPERQDGPAPGENKAVPYKAYPVTDPESLFRLWAVALQGRPGLHGVSSVAVRENGCIELFAGKSCGIRIDPNGKTTVIADKLVLASSALEIATS